MLELTNALAMRHAIGANNYYDSLIRQQSLGLSAMQFLDQQNNNSPKVEFVNSNEEKLLLLIEE